MMFDIFDYFHRKHKKRKKYNLLSAKLVGIPNYTHIYCRQCNHIFISHLWYAGCLNCNCDVSKEEFQKMYGMKFSEFNNFCHRVEKIYGR